MHPQSRLGARRLGLSPDEIQITEKIDARCLSLRLQVGDGCFHEFAILANEPLTVAAVAGSERATQVVDQRFDVAGMVDRVVGINFVDVGFEMEPAEGLVGDQSSRDR
jgi:hypothetical protein